MVNISALKSHKLYAILLLINIVGLILAFFFSSTIIIDELEHLRASYFVSLGNLPYRDFFEHHHPFIWFLYAPLMLIIPHNIYIALYCAKFVAGLFSIGSIYIVYMLVKKFLSGNKVAILGLLILGTYYVSWYTFSIIKPDTFMRFFYLLGLYNFFIYAQKIQRKNLVLCGLFMSIAFLFLQTSAFSALPLIFPLGYLAYKNKKVYSDIAFSIILPSVIILGFGGFLYFTDSLLPYWQLNWIYNAHLFDILHSGGKSVIYIYSLNLLLAIMAIVYIYKNKKQNFYVNILVLLFVCEFLQHTYFVAIYPHYLMLMFLFASVITAYAIASIQNKPIIRWFNVILATNTFLNFAILGITYDKKLTDYLDLYQKNPQVSIVSFNSAYLNVFAPKLSYYWFYPNFEYVDNSLFNRIPDYNVNKLIEENKIEYIAYDKNLFVNFDFSQVKQNVYTDYKANFELSAQTLAKYKEILPNLYQRIEQ